MEEELSKFLQHVSSELKMQGNTYPASANVDAVLASTVYNLNAIVYQVPWLCDKRGIETIVSQIVLMTGLPTWLVSTILWYIRERAFSPDSEGVDSSGPIFGSLPPEDHSGGV